MAVVPPGPPPERRWRGGRGALSFTAVGRGSYKGAVRDPCPPGDPQPPGGHAVYLDAKALLPQIPSGAYPAQALALELYRTGGVRGVEIGSVMFGKMQADGTETAAPMELVRLAIPRRTYTQSHVDYVGEVIADVAARRDALRGLRIVSQAPWLRHFTAQFAPL